MSTVHKLPTITVSASDDMPEVLQINDVLLKVLPSDIVSFQNNAVFEESYLRSKAVFAFRSKYSSNKVIITLPISVNPTPSDNDGDADSQYNGLKVLTQLTRYPYCFIRSPRIRSYISARSRISSTGFMMFAVDEVNVVQDQRSPDILFAEFHLLYCDFTSLTEDFCFRGDKIGDLENVYQEIYDPENSELFTSALDFDFEDRYRTIFAAARDMSYTDGGESTYVSTTNTPFNMIQLLAPSVLSKTELGSGDYDEEFVKDIVENYAYKEVKVTAKNGNNSFTPENLDQTNNQKTVEELTAPGSLEDAVTSVLIWWTSFHDLSFGGVSAVKNLKFSFKNKLAQQFIGSHKYPFIQYMGRYPARFNISMDYNTGEFYTKMEDFGFDPQQASVVSTLGQLNNVLDYNNEMFPEISAYNVIKLKSLVATLVGLESVVPNQTFISASSSPDAQGIEEVNISFIEADVDDFMKMNTPFPGRPSWYESGTSLESMAILALFKAYTDSAVRTKIEESDRRDTYGEITLRLSEAVKIGAGEFYGNVEANKIFEEIKKIDEMKNKTSELVGEEASSKANKEIFDFVNDKELFAIKDYATGKSIYDWPKKGIIFNTDFNSKLNNTIISFLQRRATIMSGLEEAAKSGRSLTLQESTYRSNQASIAAINTAYGLLLELANSGDEVAANIINNTKDTGKFTEKALVDFSNSYSGTNLEDLGLTELSDPTVSPFYFLLFKPYFTSESLGTINNSVEKEVIAGLEEVITKRMDAVYDDSSSHFGLFSSESGVMVNEMRVLDSENKDEGYWSTSSFGYLGSSYGAGVDRGGSWEGVPGGDPKHKLYDDIILEHANKNGVPPGLIKAIMHTESNFNPNARSPVGAYGLMQLMPATAERFNVTNRADPSQSVSGSSKYMAFLLKKFKGNTTLAIAGYNAGEGNVDKYGGIPPFRETQDYVRKVTTRWKTLYNDDSLKTGGSGTSDSRVERANNTKTTLNARSQIQAQLEQRYNDGTLKDDDLLKAKVKKIVDGDTLDIVRLDANNKEIGNSMRIRVKYLDTPETSHYTAYGDVTDVIFSGTVGGKSATKEVERLVPVNSTIFVDKSIGSSKDNSNRDLTNVYLNGSKELLAAKLIQGGFGSPWNQESGGGGPILNKLISMSNGNNKSKEIGIYKSKVKQVGDLLTKAKTAGEAINTLKANKDLLGKPTFKFKGKQYSINDTVAGPVENEKPKPATPNSIENANFPNTNMFIHLAGLQKNDKGNEKYVKDWFGARSAGRIHEGLDITSHGTSPNVVAAAAGKASTFYTGGGGKTVVINHNNGFVTRYMHLAAFGVKHGQRVSAGQGIGIVGNTNSDKGTHDTSISTILKHLHMETWVFKDYNPGSAHYAVNPWNTTQLNLLDSYSGSDVWKNIRKFVRSNQAVMGVNDKVKNRVYGFGGSGKVGILSGVQANEAVVQVAGGSIQNRIANGDPMFDSNSTYSDGPLDGVDRTSTVIGEVNDLPPTSSVYYEKGTMKLHFDNMAYHSNLALNVAFPVVKVYVVVGNEVEDPFVNGAVKMNHYFEIKGVQDIRISCNNDETPVDTLLMNIANPSFIRTDNASVAGVNVTRDFSHVGTAAEVSFISERIRLFPGARLHVRMGYSNNPNKLRTVFNGTITELGNESSITLSVLGEGYGRELLLEQLYPAQPEFARSIDTPQLISRAMSEVQCINSFGKKITKLRHYNPLQTDDDESDPETKRLTTNYLNVWKFYEPGNHRQRMYTNIYAAEVERLHSNYNTSLINHLQLLNIFNSDRSFINEQMGFGYAFNGQTPWDVLKEMEYRHPGTKIKPLFFQDRMTMFFGLKEQMYIARDLDPQYMKSIESSSDTNLHKDYLLKRPIRFELVTGLHIASSETNILMNNMKINSKFNTCANVVYFDNTSEMANNEMDESSMFTMKADDTMSAFDERYGTVRMRGIHGKYSAFMYGTTYLVKEAEKMYGGTITLVGNPCIKAGDYLYLNDNLRRYEGLVKVRECRHYMNAQTGFTTEITPGLFVEPRSFIYSALLLKLAFVAKIALANSTFSISIASNDEVDFRTYQDFLEKLKFYAKRKENWADSLGWDWMAGKVNGLTYETAGTPIVGMALGVGSVYSLSKMVASSERVNKWVMKGAAHSASIRQEINSFRSASVVLKSIWSSSSTSKDMLKYSRDTLKAARTGKNAFGVIKGGLSMAGAAAWFATSRSLASLATVASAVLLTNPIGWLIRAAVSFAFAYIGAKIQESELTRQPLLLLPIANNGRPFLAGMSGYRYDSFWEAKKENWNRNMESISKAANLMSMTTTSTTSSILSNWLDDSYIEDRVETIKKSFKNYQGPDILEKAEQEAANKGTK